MHGEHQNCPDQNKEYIIADLSVRHLPSPHLAGRVSPPLVLKAFASRAGIPIFMPSGFAGEYAGLMRKNAYKMSKKE